MTLPFTCFREVEENPLKMKYPLSRHLKNRGMGYEECRGFADENANRWFLGHVW